MAAVNVRSENSSTLPLEAATRAKLAALVAKHCATEYRLPISPTMRAAIEPALERLLGAQQQGTPLVLDAGCGTAESTAHLAELHSEALVVGVERSAGRLAKAPLLPPHAFVVRARLEEFWLLARSAGIIFTRTYLLYPNPYPKRSDLQRRWHAHPIFPTILATTHTLELRTNMQWYAAEFACALELCGWDVRCSQLQVSVPISRFERKYAARGDELWQVVASCRAMS